MAKNYAVIGDGEICKCGRPMERRERVKVTKEMLKKYWYYKEYDYCIPCKRICLYDHHKVINKNKPGAEFFSKKYNSE